MKKKLVKLNLNKQKISNLKKETIVGGLTGKRCYPSEQWSCEVCSWGQLNCGEIMDDEDTSLDRC